MATFLFSKTGIKCACLAILLITSFLNIYAQDLPHPDSLEARIDKIMSAYSSKDQPGALIGIIKDAKLIFKKGYGMANLHLNKPNDPEVAYEIASVSKQFTATAIISLIRTRKLSATDDIRKYLPAFPQYGKTITINDLLYHTSGIRDYMVLMWLTGQSFENKFSNADALKIIYRQRKLHFTTGTRCVYSNSNYVLLAEIIKQVSGVSLPEYARKVLFLPLQMKNTGFDVFKSSAKTLKATSYYRDTLGYRSFKNDNRVSGDGGLVTTINDLLKWDNTFYDPASLTAGILVTGKLDNGNPLSYGMGIMTGKYKGQLIQMHPGAFLGYRAEVLRFPEKRITIICLANTEEVNPEQITREIADTYVFNQAIKSQTPALSAQENAVLTGKYEIAPNVFVDVRFENGQLSGQLTGQPRQLLKPYEKDTFRIGDSEDKAVFSQLEDGKMQQLIVVQKQSKIIAKRPEVIPIKQINNYVGTYYSDEQQASYVLYVKNHSLYFRAGKGPEIKAEVLKNNNRIYFGYQNLEQATIDFQLGANGQALGFILNSGRVSDLKFVR